MQLSCTHDFRNNDVLTMLMPDQVGYFSLPLHPRTRPTLSFWIQHPIQEVHKNLLNS